MIFAKWLKRNFACFLLQYVETKRRVFFVSEWSVKKFWFDFVSRKKLLQRKFGVFTIPTKQNLVIINCYYSMSKSQVRLQLLLLKKYKIDYNNMQNCIKYLYWMLNKVLVIRKNYNLKFLVLNFSHCWKLKFTFVKVEFPCQHFWQCTTPICLPSSS